MSSREDRTVMNGKEGDGEARSCAARVDLAQTLADIERCDERGEYDDRYMLVMSAMLSARRLGYPAGIGWDHGSGPDMDGFRIVVYIETPVGQLSWHMPEHDRGWDGHTTEMKYRRARAWTADVLAGTGLEPTA